MICVASCTTNIPSVNNQNCDCDFIYGPANDWDNISDDLIRNIYKHNLKCEILYDNID